MVKTLQPVVSGHAPNGCHSRRSEETPPFALAVPSLSRDPRSYLTPHISHLEPKPSNLEPETSNLEPHPSNLEPKPSNLQAGFTLLELLIVMMIIATLAAMAIPSYTRNVQAAKEAVLREDLQVMRTAISSYTVDKQKAPQALEDIVSSGYLKAVPKDPITGRTDTWITSQSDTLSSIDQTDSGGIDDVHSGAQANAIDGTSYTTW